MNFKSLLTFALAAASLTASAEAPYTYSAGDVITNGDKEYVVVGDNLITNGDFTQGYTWWKTGQGSVINADNFTISEGAAPNNGNALVSKTGGGSGGNGSIKQEIAVENGKTYFVSLWANSNNCDWARVNINGDDNKCIISKPDLKTTSWTHRTAVYTSAAANEKITIALAWMNNAQFAWFNIVEVEENISKNLIVDANAALESADYANITGQERTDLQAAVASENVEALQNALAAFKAAKASYDAYAAKVVEVNSVLDNCTYATADKIAALRALVIEPANAAEAAEAVNSFFNNIRIVVESNSIAEAIEGSTDATSYIINPCAADDINGWTLAQGDGGAKINSVSGEKPVLSNGTELSYFDGGNWGGSDWTTRFEQTTVGLPAGKYRLAVTARGSVDLRWFRLAVTNANGDIAQVDLVHDGTSDKGSHFTKGYKDHFVDFETTGDILISIQANAQKGQQWQGFTNFRLTNIGAAALSTDALEAAIATARNLVDTTVGGEAEGQYPVDLRNALEDALNSAESVSAKVEGAAYSEELQSEINSAAEALNAAINAYTPAKILVIADKWYYIRQLSSGLYYYAAEAKLRLSAKDPFHADEIQTYAAEINNETALKDHIFKLMPVEGGYTIETALGHSLACNGGWNMATTEDETQTPAVFSVVENNGNLVIKTPNGHLASDNTGADSALYSDKGADHANAPVAFETVPQDHLSTGIENVAADAAEKETVVYDLFGRRVDNPSNGIYIVNGKKTVIR